MPKSTPGPRPSHGTPLQPGDLEAVGLASFTEKSRRGETSHYNPPRLARLAGEALGRLNRRSVLLRALKRQKPEPHLQTGVTEFRRIKAFAGHWFFLAEDCSTLACDTEQPPEECLLAGVAGVALVALVCEGAIAVGEHRQLLDRLQNDPLPEELRPLAREIARGIVKPHRDEEKILAALWGILDATESSPLKVDGTRPGNVDAKAECPPPPETEPATPRRKRTTEPRETREAALLAVFAQHHEAVGWTDRILADAAELSASDLRRILESPRNRTLDGYALRRRHQRAARDGRGRFTKRDRATVADLRGGPEAAH